MEINKPTKEQILKELNNDVIYTVEINWGNTAYEIEVEASTLFKYLEYVKDINPEKELTIEPRTGDIWIGKDKCVGSIYWEG